MAQTTTQTNQKKQILILVALVLVGGFVWYEYFGAGVHPHGGGLFHPGPYEQIVAEDYSKPIKELESTRKTEYKHSGRNIFVIGPAAVADPVKAAAAAKAAPPPYRPIGPQPPPPPPKPELDMKFFGVGATPANGPRCAFLQDKDDEVHIVSEGDTIEKRLRITHIGNDRIEFEDINTGLKNTKNLEMPTQPPA
jgi:hypothetical protein